VRHLLLTVPLVLTACVPAGTGSDDDDDDAGDCAYPDDPVHPMEVDEVLFPYSWPTAIHVADDTTAALDIEDVACATSDEIDWSPFDVLLFVSIPAW